MKQLLVLMMLMFAITMQAQHMSKYSYNTVSVFDFNDGVLTMTDETTVRDSYIQINHTEGIIRHQMANEADVFMIKRIYAPVSDNAVYYILAVPGKPEMAVRKTDYGTRIEILTRVSKYRYKLMVYK